MEMEIRNILKDMIIFLKNLEKHNIPYSKAIEDLEKLLSNCAVKEKPLHTEIKHNSTLS